MLNELGKLHMELKALEDSLKEDSYILELKQQIELAKDKYIFEIKDVKKKIKRLELLIRKQQEENV